MRDRACGEHQGEERELHGDPPNRSAMPAP
jgi:hypothetical protein